MAYTGTDVSPAEKRNASEHRRLVIITNGRFLEELSFFCNDELRSSSLYDKISEWKREEVPDIRIGSKNTRGFERMKRALIVTSIGGFLPQFEMNDVRILQEYGMEVHYASDFQEPFYHLDLDQLREQGIHLHPVSIHKSPAAVARNLRAFFEIRKLIDREEIDLVHCHNPMGGVVGRLAAALSRRKPKVIYTAHGFHFYKGAPLFNWLFFYPVERWLAHFTDVIVTINAEDRERAKTFRLRHGGRVYRIHGVGVDMNRYRPQRQKRREMRASLGIPEDAFHVVTAAELNENKNQSTVIRAIAAMEDSAVCYSICGKGSLAEKLQEEIDAQGLGEHVRLLGYRHDIEDVLQSADCFAFPSFREGLGVAAVEALACGVPLIAADNRGTREYLQDQVNGLRCSASDPPSFTRALERLKADDTLRERISRGCRDSVARFSVEDTDRRMRNIYREVIHEQ